MYEAIEIFEEVEKLGQDLLSADPLEEINIGDEIMPRPTILSSCFWHYKRILLPRAHNGKYLKMYYPSVWSDTFVKTTIDNMIITLGTKMADETS
jgi:hypothetical protein